MKRCAVLLALCGVLMAAVPVVAAGVPVNVINNVLAESITNTAKGPRISKPIVQFKQGTTADFQSLTQFLIEEPGIYSVRLEITGPDNRLRASSSFSMEASSPNWTHSQHTYWRSVRFDIGGVYRFIVQVDNRPIANFPISAVP